MVRRTPRWSIQSMLSLIVGVLLVSGQVRAWGPNGHRTIATIAQRLLVGTRAEKHVHTILGPIDLVAASVWADCAKGVMPPGFNYVGAGRFPECGVFETTAGEADMIDYVRRNDSNCDRKPTEESCHKQYHYADIAIEHNHYDSSFHGARPDDIVGAVRAAIQVLLGFPAESPFSIRDRREALLLLAHYVGDIHQPLHVGAIYLDPNGKRVDPDTAPFDPATETRGGNQIAVDRRGKLHAAWDAIPTSFKDAQVSVDWVRHAAAVPVTKGKILHWSATWASDTQKEAVAAFRGLTFGPRTGSTWDTTLASDYRTSMDAIKERQLTKAGARLAQLLMAIWP